ncbi:MAG: hypothetical protein ACREP4_12845 [Stenotrophomonas sp.]|uniref:hypothetical protein n=1 Tax=Stenotrophomonas sp. TaxID=69392 RepID=UPI003D6D6843
MPIDKRKLRDRATRAARALKREKSTFGYIDDGSGKRYRIGVYFLMAGELQKSADAFDAFHDEFPDDTGEPVFHLYSALAAYRCEELNKASDRLLATQLSNPFLLPHLTGRTIDVGDVWLPSNWHQEDYLQAIAEFLDEPTEAERHWISEAMDMPPFTALRDGFISTYSALKNEHDLNKRHAILEQWRCLKARHLSSEV